MEIQRTNFNYFYIVYFDYTLPISFQILPTFLPANFVLSHSDFQKQKEQWKKKKKTKPAQK